MKRTLVSLFLLGIATCQQVIDVVLQQGYLIEVQLGSNNQTANFQIAINGDMVVVPSTECTARCEQRRYNRFTSTTPPVDIVRDTEFPSIDFSDFFTNITFVGNTVKDRVCLRGAQQQTCMLLNFDHMEFLYVKNYINPMNPTANFRSQGILGLAPSKRNHINSYLEYLVAKNLIPSNSYTLNMNQIGSRSRLLLGHFDEDYHFLNYTNTNLTLVNQPIYTFPIGDVLIGGYQFEPTIRTVKDRLNPVDTVIANLYPFIRFQTTSPTPDRYFEALNKILPNHKIRYLTDTLETDEQPKVMFQPYFEQIDCADVAINTKQFSVVFTTVQNYQFTMNQALFRQEGDDCVVRMVFAYNATRSLIILGQPAFFNINITISFERGLIGFSNGKNLTPVRINYTPRVILMMVVFAILVTAAIALNFTIDKARQERKEAKEGKEEQLIQDKHQTAEDLAESLE